MGIYNGLYSVTPDILPPQSVPLKEKIEKTRKDGSKTWGETCLDALEAIGKSQYNNNIKLIENYEMVKGRFIYSHYLKVEGYQSMVQQLSAEFEIPNTLRHYDIISPVINTMSGEWQARPDIFKVRQVGDGAANEYLRKKVDLTKQYVFTKINAEISAKLLAQGIDENKDDFATEQEAQQYHQQIEEYKQQLTPPDIQKYMDTDFLTQAEIWATHQKELDKEMFNLPEKEKVEFEDMLIADRAFRHFYLTSTGWAQETWNPIHTFFHKSSDIIPVEEGDYVGRIFSLSLNTIIDRYGYLMSTEDFDLINGKNEDNDKKWADSKYNWVYNNYLMPFKGYPAYDIMKQSWNKGVDNSIPMAGAEFFNSLYNTNNDFGQREGYYFVTEAYWKTQKLIYKITVLDEELNIPIVKIVDENFIIPDYFTEASGLFTDQQQPNTYIKTYVNEVWKGIKINTGVDKNLRKDLYLAIGPNDFQFKGDLNIYGSKLPVCGQVFSVRNSHSMSMVDLMKPHQIGYNLAINQLYQYAEKEIGMFAILDVNMFPNAKDWGGEDSWEKWMLIAKNLGMLPADTSPGNISASLAATGGFLPKILDLNAASQMVSRMNIAKFFEEQALKQVGFNDYRTGNFSNNATATGVQQGVAKSYSQTESYFTNFSNYLRRCYQMDLGIAQYVQSQKEDVTFTYIKSDLSRAFIKILGSDLLLCDLGVFVTNSQEQARQLEMMRQFALSNNTAGMSPVDVSDVILMNSPQEIRRQLEVSYNKLMQNQEQAQKAQQQQLEQKNQLEQQAIITKHEEFKMLLENNLDKERIKAGLAVINDPNEIQEPTPIDNTGNVLKAEQIDNENNINNQKLNLEQQRLNAETIYKQQDLAVKQAKIVADLQIQNKETETARILMHQKNKQKNN